MPLEQAAEGHGPDQGHVAGENQHGLASLLGSPLHLFPRHLDRVPGAELRRLRDEVEIAVVQRRPHQLLPVPHNHDQPHRVERRELVENVGDQGSSQGRMEHLGKIRVHTLPEPRGQDHSGERRDHLSGLPAARPSQRPPPGATIGMLSINLVLPIRTAAIRSPRRVRRGSGSKLLGSTTPT